MQIADQTNWRKYVKTGRYLVMHNLGCGCRYLVKLTFIRNKTSLDPIMKWEILYKENDPDSAEDNSSLIGKCDGCTGLGDRGMKDIVVTGVYDEKPVVSQMSRLIDLV